MQQHPYNALDLRADRLRRRPVTARFRRRRQPVVRTTAAER